MIRPHWKGMTPPRQGLDDPDYAAQAWGRYRRLLGWMGLFSAACGMLAVWVLWRWTGAMPIHMGIATFLGVFLTMLIAVALMGLVFLSSGTGHDEQVEDPLRGEVDVD